MRKRNAPVLLLSMLFLLISAVVIFGMTHDNQKPNQPDPTSHSDEPSDGDLAQNVKTAVAPGGKKMPGMATPTTDGPSIALPKTAGPRYSKPVHSADGDTSFGWYH